MMKTRTNLIVALFALCFTGTVSDAYAWGWHKRKSVKKQGGFLSCIFFTGLHPLLSYTIGSNYRHQIGTVCVNHGNRIEQPVLCMARRELSDLLC